MRSLEAKIEKLLEERNSTDGKEGHAEDKAPISPFECHQMAEELSSPPHPSVKASGKNGGESNRWVSEISIDSHGGVCYHNPTSAIHESSIKRRLF